MSLKDKLEIGLKPDAPYRKDNLPEFQQDDPACEVGAIPGDADEVKDAREDCTDGRPKTTGRPPATPPDRPSDPSNQTPE